VSTCALQSSDNPEETSSVEPRDKQTSGTIVAWNNNQTAFQPIMLFNGAVMAMSWIKDFAISRHFSIAARSSARTAMNGILRIA
jgi:hypothetical protein